MNFQKRAKHLGFWVGIVGVVLTSLQVEASSLNTWWKVLELIERTLSNPYLLTTTAMAIFGVLIDPSTSGITDGECKEVQQNTDLMIEDVEVNEYEQ